MGLLDEAKKRKDVFQKSEEQKKLEENRAKEIDDSVDNETLDIDSEVGSLSESLAKRIDSIKKKDEDVSKHNSTDLDLLYEMIKSTGKMNLKEISEKFKITIAKAEEWAKILDKHKLLFLHYPPVGYPILKRPKNA